MAARRSRAISVATIVGTINAVMTDVATTVAANRNLCQKIPQGSNRNRLPLTLERKRVATMQQSLQLPILLRPGQRQTLVLKNVASVATAGVSVDVVAEAIDARASTTTPVLLTSRGRHRKPLRQNGKCLPQPKPRVRLRRITDHGAISSGVGADVAGIADGIAAAETMVKISRHPNSFRWNWVPLLPLPNQHQQIAPHRRSPNGATVPVEVVGRRDVHQEERPPAHMRPITASGNPRKSSLQKESAQKENVQKGNPRKESHRRNSLQKGNH
jgi:hypothetical protein